MGQQIAFYVFAFLTVLSGALVISVKNPISSAISLIVTLGSVAGLFVLLDAHFVATIQVLVYAGAIMVLFVFVIMLLNLEPELAAKLDLSTRKLLGLGFAGAGTILLLWKFLPITTQFGTVPTNYGTMEAVATKLFIDYLIPFEAVSLLLTAAVVGAVVVGKREL